MKKENTQIKRHSKHAIYYDNKPMQYTAIFNGRKNDDNFQMKNYDIFFFCSKHRSWVHVRTASMRRI